MAKSSTPSINVAAASMADLIAFFNEHAVVPVKRFADRKSAEKRVAALIAELAQAAKDAAPAKKSAAKAKGESAAAAAANTDRSAAIAATWADPAVASARAQRNGVSVAGAEYPSVKAAFVALNLPLGVHIRFRGQLKAAGKLAFGDHMFKLLPARAAAE